MKIHAVGFVGAQQGPRRRRQAEHRLAVDQLDLARNGRHMLAQGLVVGKLATLLAK
jgi:hypothetical protein